MWFPSATQRTKRKVILKELKEWAYEKADKARQGTNKKAAKPKKVVEEEQKYRVIASSIDQKDFWTVGYYADFNKAKEEIDNLDTSTVIYYIYSDNNRVLYSTTGETDG